MTYKYILAYAVFIASVLATFLVVEEMNDRGQERAHTEQSHTLWVEDKESEIQTNKRLRELQIEATEKEVNKKDGMRG